MEEFMKLVAQYQCNTNVDVSSSESDTDSDITYKSTGKPNKGNKDGETDGGKRKTAGSGSGNGTNTARMPTRRPDPNVYNRNALLARENRRKKKAYMEAVEKELHETRNTNKSLLKALKKQFKLTQKLEKQCEYLKNSLGNYKGTKYLARSLNADIQSPNNRAESPEGSLVSSYSYSSSSYEPQLESNSFPGLLSVDNGSVAEKQFINEPPTSSWNDFIDDLLTEYQPSTPESPSRPLEESSSFPMTDFQEFQSPPLGIIDEHSYFNKFTEIGFSPNSNYGWSASCTPPTQLLQDDYLQDISDGECLASL